MEKQQSWYVIRTKANEEVRAAINLNAWGVDTFAPLLEPRRRDRTARPLFPCYIFALFNLHAMLRKVNLTRGVLSVVSFGGITPEICDEIICDIRARTNEQGFVKLTRPFVRGDNVQINSGPLKGIEGVFDRELAGSARVRILLNSVAYNAKVEISAYDLSLLTEAAA